MMRLAIAPNFRTSLFQSILFPENKPTKHDDCDWSFRKPELLLWLPCSYMSIYGPEQQQQRTRRQLRGVRSRAERHPVRFNPNCVSFTPWSSSRICLNEEFFWVTGHCVGNVVVMAANRSIFIHSNFARRDRCVPRQ